MAQGDALPVGDRDVVRSAHLRARHQLDARAAAGPGAFDPVLPAAERLAAAGDAQSGIGDEPDDDDRCVLEEAVHDRAVGARPLDDQAAPDGCSRRRQRRYLGPAGAAAAGAIRSRTAAEAQGDAGTDHQDRRGRPVRVAPDLPECLLPGDRRLDRHPQSAARCPARPAHLLPGGPGARPGRRRVGSPGRRGQGGGRPSPGHRGRIPQWGRGTAAARRKIPRRQHARDHAGRGHGARGVAARPPGGGRRLADLPSGDVHRDGVRESRDRPAPRRRARGARAGRLHGLVADRADQPDRDPAVAAGRRGRAQPAWRHPQHDGARGVRDRHGGHRRRRHHRRRAHRAEAAAAPVGRQRPVDRLDHLGRVARGEPTRSLRDADRPARGGSRLLHGGLVGRLLHAPGGLLCSGGRRLGGGGAHRHSRAGLDAPERHAHQGPCGPARPVAAARL